MGKIHLRPSTVNWRKALCRASFMHANAVGEKYHHTSDPKKASCKACLAEKKRQDALAENPVVYKAPCNSNS